MNEASEKLYEVCLHGCIEYVSTSGDLYVEFKSLTYIGIVHTTRFLLKEFCWNLLLLSAVLNYIPDKVAMLTKTLI